jgi:hypothetical protein
MVPPLRRAVPALLLVGVAGIQLALVHSVGLSRWRGGGLGMYTEFHPNRTELWALTDAGPVLATALPADQWRDGCLPTPATCTRVPHDACLRRLAGCLADDSPVTRIEAWRPRFSPADRRWTLDRVAAVDR